MVIQLLALGRHGSEKGPSCENKIRAASKYLFIDKKVFLLWADAGADIFYVLAEELQNPHCLTVQCLHGAKQRSFLIQCVSRVGAEGCGDAKRMILDKGI